MPSLSKLLVGVIAACMASTTLAAPTTTMTTAHLPAFCTPLSIIISDLSLQSSATTFCRSLLSITPVTTIQVVATTTPTSVIYSTTTASTTVTSTTSTTSITQTSTSSTITTSLSTTTTTTATTISTSIILPGVNPAGVKAAVVYMEAKAEPLAKAPLCPTPTQLKGLPSLIASQVCSCLNIAPSTVVVASTSTAPTSIATFTVTSSTTGSTTETDVTTTTLVLTSLTTTSVVATVTSTSSTTTTVANCGATQVITNGGFESGVAAPWTVVGTGQSVPDKPGSAYDGNYFLDFYNSDTAQISFNFSQVVPTCPGAQFSLSFAVLTISYTGYQPCGVQACVGTTCTTIDLTYTNGSPYNVYTLNGTVPTTATSLPVIFTSRGAIGTAGSSQCIRTDVRFDDISLTLL